MICPSKLQSIVGLWRLLGVVLTVQKIRALWATYYLIHIIAFFFYFCTVAGGDAGVYGQYPAKAQAKQ